MDRLISQFEVIRAIEKYVDNIFTKNMGDLINDIKDIPSAEPYKGMKNGEVIKAMFPQTKTRGENMNFISFTLDGIVGATVEKDWWNSPYEPQERSDKE